MAFNDDEERVKELWDNYIRDRSIENRNELVMFYQPYVKITIGKLVSQYNRYIEYDDLISYGTMGLIDAVEKFDVNKGVKFETYASIRIRGGIIDQLRRQDWLPASMRKRIKRAEAVYAEIEQEQGRTPSDDEVSERLGIEKDELKSLMDTSHMANVMAFEDVVAANAPSSGETMNCDPEYTVEEKFIRTALMQAVDKLKEKERLVVSMYYYEGLTLKEIGAVLGVSESRVSQIHSKILQKLKDELEDIVKN